MFPKGLSIRQILVKSFNLENALVEDPLNNDIWPRLKYNWCSLSDTAWMSIRISSARPDNSRVNLTKEHLGNFLIKNRWSNGRYDQNRGRSTLDDAIAVAENKQRNNPNYKRPRNDSRPRGRDY